MKPGPDPHQKDETKWMTEEQIHENSLMTSRYWIKAGIGELGKVQLEITRCEGLPSKDIAVFSKNGGTDAFFSIVYEDVVVNTDVINNDNNLFGCHGHSALSYSTLLTHHHRSLYEELIVISFITIIILK